jgi:hypothetical protein
LTYELSDCPDGTHLQLSQDGNADQEAAQHSAHNWASMLESLKSVVEESPV